MKWPGITVFLFSTCTAWSQIKTGTVLYVDFEDELTIAADSRMTFGNGLHDDQECKISAFGNQFVFAMAGVVKREQEPWNAHTVARQVWEEESKKEVDPVRLVQIIANKWVTQMEEIYKQSRIFPELRKIQPENTGVLANGVFGASNGAGVIAAYSTNITFDRPLFDSSSVVSIGHNGTIVPRGQFSAGHDEIAMEFGQQTSGRAKEYMDRFMPQLPSGKSEKRAAIAAKLIELSILLHPKSSELGFPVDVVQLAPKTGVSWVALKPNCPKQ
jgi:hypothetical protein